MTDRQSIDTDLTRAATAALMRDALVPRAGITVGVSDGWVTLAGTVDWQYERTAAARAMRELADITGVTNAIVVKPHVHASEVEAKIEAAFRQSAERDARRVSVTAIDGTVILSGRVRTWTERQEAERAAWAAPGVRTVDDRLIVAP